jgi:hypothetical protein
VVAQATHENGKKRLEIEREGRVRARREGKKDGGGREAGRQWE